MVLPAAWFGIRAAKYLYGVALGRRKSPLVGPLFFGVGYVASARFTYHGLDLHPFFGSRKAYSKRPIRLRYF